MNFSLKEFVFKRGRLAIVLTYFWRDPWCGFYFKQGVHCGWTTWLTLFRFTVHVNWAFDFEREPV